MIFFFKGFNDLMMMMMCIQNKFRVYIVRPKSIDNIDMV